MENKFIREVIEDMLDRRENRRHSIKIYEDRIEQNSKFLNEFKQELNQIEETLKILGYKEEE